MLYWHSMLEYTANRLCQDNDQVSVTTIVAREADNLGLSPNCKLEVTNVFISRKLNYLRAYKTYFANKSLALKVF